MSYTNFSPLPLDFAWAKDYSARSNVAGTSDVPQDFNVQNYPDEKSGSRPIRREKLFPENKQSGAESLPLLSRK
ncbi:hypothetical protein HY407_04460 [Candidatus Gottesmanbacteria bacterium]|nr:hypothetical protein [Candidatus Gottesmanbacteria bacterium]